MTHSTTAQARRNRRLKEIKRDLLNQERESRGGCEWPGCQKLDELTFHHLEPEARSFTIGKRWVSWSVGALKTELAKCKLLCKGHHLKAEGMAILGETLPWPLS